MTPGSGLFILLFLLKFHCPHFIYYGDEGDLDNIQGIGIQIDHNEKIRFSEIFKHVLWDEYKDNFYHQVREQRRVALDASASFVAHEKLKRELARYLDDNELVYVTLIRLGGQNCEEMLDDLRRTNRSAHSHLKLMYTCHRETTNGTQTELNYYLLLVDTYLSEVTDASTLGRHEAEQQITTIFSDDLAYHENGQSSSSNNDWILERNEVCSGKCDVYCTREDKTRLTEVVIGESRDFIKVSRPSNMTKDAFYTISDPVFGGTICLNCTRNQQPDSDQAPMCHSGFTFQLRVTIVFAILFVILLYTLKRRHDKLTSHTHLNHLESAERQWILKQGAELLAHILCCGWNLLCSCHPHSSTVSLRHDHIAQSLISWLFVAANVIVPYLSYFSWPPGAWVYFVAFAIALTGFVIQVVVISGIDLELLPNTTCSLTGQELSIILVASTSWGTVAIICLCALVTVPPIVARCYYGKSLQRKSYVICGADLATVAICGLLSTISVTMKNVELEQRSLLGDSQVILAVRLIIMLAVIAYFHHQDCSDDRGTAEDCAISGDEVANRGTPTSDDDASNGDTQPHSEFKPGARRAISIHMQTLINRFEQRS